jgi:serine/threonine protein phosphatase 1
LADLGLLRPHGRRDIGIGAVRRFGASPYRLRDGLRIYAIGDVHGRNDLLAAVFARIDRDLSERPLGRAMTILLGDYIDKGPRSRETLDLIVARRRGAATELVCLKGNHEAMLLEALAAPVEPVMGRWLANGGAETLISYGIDPGSRRRPRMPAEIAGEIERKIPRDHLEFLGGLPSMVVEDGYLFVHAGIRPRVPFDGQVDDDLLWIRDPFLNSPVDFGKRVVHGHTPVAEPELRRNRINIDTGAFLTNRLTCLVIEGDGIAFLEPDHHGLHADGGGLARWRADDASTQRKFADLQPAMGAALSATAAR